MRGKCIDVGATTVLDLGVEYFLFENGEDYVYVSRFNNLKAHLGCYKRELFQVLKDAEEPASDHLPELDKEKLYRADLIWRKPGYSNINLQLYYLKPLGTHAYFYNDQRLQEFRGCFPLKWFNNFVEVEVIEDEIVEEEVIMLPVDDWEQMSLF